MREARAGESALDEALHRLRHEQAVVVELDDLRDLVRESEADPLTNRRGPRGPVLDDLVATLTAAQRLPDTLVVRVRLPGVTTDGADPSEVEAALHRLAAYRATLSWRAARAVRLTGRAHAISDMAIALGCWALAYLFAYLATSVGVSALGVLLAMMAAISITIAWVFSWMVIEPIFFDWRADGRKAAAYDLLAGAHVEVEQA